ncbi:hypothetical protein [Aeromonas jandaei]|uniref:hypothetical protein n=1 Tax=Aeromonas jandaei TaxID=650 RepID=UPI003EC91A51
MNTTSATSLTSLYRDLHLSSAGSQQELRASNGNLYLKEGKGLVSVESHRLAHRDAAIAWVITAMSREYGMSTEEAGSLLRSVQADSGKVTVADVRQLHNELTLGARHQSERSQELQQVADLRKQQLASATRAQGSPPIFAPMSSCAAPSPGNMANKRSPCSTRNSPLSCTARGC